MCILFCLIDNFNLSRLLIISDSKAGLASDNMKTDGIL